MKKIMKNIIMMVLVIAAALSGITVPTRKAGALYVGNNIEWRNKIKELLGTEDTTGIQCMTVNSEIIWLADKYGNVIVDDRPMDIRPEYSEGVDNYGEGYSVTEGFTAQFKYESSYTWEEWCKQQPDKGPYPVASSWSSDNPDIADVDQNGVVTAKKPGKTVIRAKTFDSGREMAKEITVIRNWVKDEDYIQKAKAKYVLSYDKNGNAVCKVTIKNTSKKKYI